jgi:hypothetical protein
MNHWEYFLFLFYQGLGFITSTLPLMIPFFIAFILLLYRTFKMNAESFKRIYLISLIPFLFPFLMVAWGTFFEHTQAYTAKVPDWQLGMLSWLLCFQIGFNIVCLIYFKGIRLPLAILSLIQMGFTLPFLLIASMSVGGVWL